MIGDEAPSAVNDRMERGEKALSSRRGWSKRRKECWQQVDAGGRLFSPRAGRRRRRRKELSDVPSFLAEGWKGGSLCPSSRPAEIEMSGVQLTGGKRRRKRFSTLMSTQLLRVVEEKIFLPKAEKMFFVFAGPLF